MKIVAYDAEDTFSGKNASATFLRCKITKKILKKC